MFKFKPCLNLRGDSCVGLFFFFITLCSIFFKFSIFHTLFYLFKFYFLKHDQSEWQLPINVFLWLTQWLFKIPQVLNLVCWILKENKITYGLYEERYANSKSDLIQPPFFLDFERCWKRSFEILVHDDMNALSDSCRFFRCTLWTFPLWNGALSYRRLQLCI